MKVSGKNLVGHFNIKDNKKSDEKVEALKTSLEKVKEAIDGANFKSEEEKIAYEKRLNDRIKLGAKLSPKEMNYLLRSNPIMYMRIKRIQSHRESLERRLKRCRSKKEVEQAYSDATSMIHPKDPDKQSLANAFGNVTRDFKKTREYHALPMEIKDKINDKRRREQQRELIYIYGGATTIDKSV